MRKLLNVGNKEANTTTSTCKYITVYTHILTRRADKIFTYLQFVVPVLYFSLCIIDDIALVLHQNRLRWYGHVLRKEDDDWVKKCMEYEVESPRPRGRPKRTWREVVREDCQARKTNRVDAIDRCKWRKMIKDVRRSGWV